MLIAIDPGYTSGTCIADRITGASGSSSFAVTACVELLWINRFYYYEVITANGTNIEAIIIERYKLFDDPKTLKSQIGSEIPSARIIGVVEAAAYAAGIPDRVFFAEPWQRKQVTVLAEHRDLVGLSKHNQDAYRHLRYYVQTHRKGHN